MGHEERFPLTRLSAGYGFRKETIAGTRRNGRDAPKPATWPSGLKVFPPPARSPGEIHYLSAGMADYACALPSLRSLSVETRIRLCARSDGR